MENCLLLQQAAVPPNRYETKYWLLLLILSADYCTGEYLGLKAEPAKPSGFFARSRD